MRKFTDYKNEDALDLLADLLDPISNIAVDKEFTNNIHNRTKMESIQYVLKSHSSDIIKVLARLDDVPVKEYQANSLQIVKQLLEIVNDEDFISFFRSQGQRSVSAPSGSATESTEETAAE